MTRKQASDVRPLVQLRIIATSVSAAVKGLLSVVFGRGGRDRVRLEPGDPAPDFELPGSDDQVYRLSQFRGREAVVLAWFPMAFTSGCSAECASLQSSQPALQAFRARYFAVSTDAPETNRQFARALGLQFPILSDVGGHVARAYGVLGASGYPSRWTFFVATDGRIAAIDKRVRAMSHGRDIVTRLGDLNL